METQSDIHLSRTPAGQTDQELLYSGYGVRASTIWHDRYNLAHGPHQICPEPGSPASGRVGSLGVLPGSLDVICAERTRSARGFEAQGFFQRTPCPAMRL